MHPPDLPHPLSRPPTDKSFSISPDKSNDVDTPTKPTGHFETKWGPRRTPEKSTYCVAWQYKQKSAGTERAVESDRTLIQLLRIGVDLMLTTHAGVQPSREELLRLWEEPGIEMVNGQIVEKAMNRESARVAARIITLLSNAIGKSGSAEVYDQTLGYQCFADDPGGFRKPDVSVIRTERLSSHDEGIMRIPADLVIEVVSPGDRAVELDEKITEYLSNGFALLWVVFPNTQKVVIYRPGSSPVQLGPGDEITCEPVTGFRRKVAEFFEK